MERGTIIRVVDGKGFGFIRRLDDAEARDVFFHATALHESLEFNQQLLGKIVEFEVVSDKRAGKSRAVSVRPV